MESGVQSKATVRERAIEELMEFLILTAYLYVCFATLIYLKAAILQANGIAYAPCVQEIWQNVRTGGCGRTARCWN
jgi:hypothetical protein